MSRYNIVANSSMDLNDGDVELVPFTITVEGQEFVDTVDFHVPELVTAMQNSKEGIQTACPGPGAFLDAMERAAEDAEGVFVITISSKLSGSYQSAHVAAQIFEDKYPDKGLHIIDSKSASAGEVSIYLELKALIAQGLEFDRIVERIENYAENMRTFFNLGNMDNLVRNGRMKRPTGFIAGMLNLRLLMRANDGEIELEEMARGEKGAIKKITNLVKKYTKTGKGANLVITEASSKAFAHTIKEQIEKRYDFDQVIVLPAKGLSTGYMGGTDGIVMAFDARY